MAGTTEWGVGIRQSTTWGTPVLISVVGGDLLKVESDSMPPGIPEVIKDDNVGEPMSGATFQGNISVEGQITMAARYDGTDLITALFMGSDAYTVHDTTLGEHSQIFQNSNTGIHATVVVDREFGTISNKWEYQTCKVSQIELSHSDGKLMIAPTFIANRCERGAPLGHLFGPGDATPAVVRSPTDMILFNHLHVAMTEVTGSEVALDFAGASADRIRLTDLKITANRNITGDHESGSDSPAAEGDYIPGAGEIGEPETDGLPEGQVEITFANHSLFVDDLIVEAQQRQAGSIPKVYKLHAKWEGRGHPAATIPPISSKFHAEFAALTIADAPVQAGGPGAKAPVTITFDIVTPQVLPSNDMAWADTIGQKPFRFYYINGFQPSLLA